MGPYAAGQVVFLTFPFSDLSRSKLRPVLLIANTGESEWIACQITSNPYADSLAIPLSTSAFKVGGLPRTSFIRPGKLFTAHESLIKAYAGLIFPEHLSRVRDVIEALIRGSASEPGW